MVDTAPRPSTPAALIERRRLLSEIAVLVLLGVAFDEMATAIWDTLRDRGPTAPAILLFLVFFLTTMRFAIGNHLYLTRAADAAYPSALYLYDFLVIALQTTFLIFLGASSSAEVGRLSHVGFADVLIALYCLDVLWIASHALVLDRLSPHDCGMVLSWAVLNGSLALVLLGLKLSLDDLYAMAGLVPIAALSAAAFALDSWMVWSRSRDVRGLLSRPGSPPRHPR